MRLVNECILKTAFCSHMLHNNYLYYTHLNRRHIQPSSGLVVKLDLQLYQIDQKNYLLDFKCVNPTDEELGDEEAAHDRHFTMEFFEICSRLISSLAQ